MNKHDDISFYVHQKFAQARLVGSKELEALIARDEYQARARLEDADSSHSDRTMFDNYDVAVRIGINRNYQLS